MTPQLTDTPVLTTERLTLRAPQPADFAALVPFVTSDRARFVGGGTDKTMGDAWRVLAIFAGHWHLRGYGLFVLTDRTSGGYAREAVIAIRRHAYGDLGWTTAVSYIDDRNDRSIALARRLGCTLDQDAAAPKRDATLQVWRHPAPSEVAA